MGNLGTPRQDTAYLKRLPIYFYKKAQAVVCELYVPRSKFRLWKYEGSHSNVHNHQFLAIPCLKSLR